jgi:hypothetical protein
MGARFEREELSYSLPKDELNLQFVGSLSDQICAVETSSTDKKDSPEANQKPSDLDAILALDEEEIEDSSVEYIATVKHEVGPPRAKRLRTNDYEGDRMNGTINFLQGSLISQLRD